MSKKPKAKVPKSGTVWRQTADEATLAQNPRYNGFACGHGVHGETKYSRAKAKRAWQKQLRQEGASRGSFPFHGLVSSFCDQNCAFSSFGSKL